VTEKKFNCDNQIVMNFKDGKLGNDC